MTRRESQQLPIVRDFRPAHDAVIRPGIEYDRLGRSDCDLNCGQDDEILLRNFSIEEAQRYFGRENVRVVAKCPSCGSYNLVAGAVQKGDDRGFITFPDRQ
jgi:hypothetical protein